MAEDDIGSIAVSITGDWADLQASFDAAETAATQAGASIAAALNAGASGVNVTVDQGLLDSLTAAGNAAQQATPSFENLAGAENDAGAAAHEAEGGLAAMAEQLLAIGEGLAATEALKEFGAEALNAYGAVQSTTKALDQFTKSTETSAELIEQVKSLAATEPFSFPEVAASIQKMVALGTSIEQIPAVMQAVADTAAATGNSFDAVASSIDRLALSGVAGQRQLVALGLNTEQLGQIMGVTASQVAAAFLALDQSQRLDVLTQALQKFGGAAAAQAQTVAGAWQVFQNQFEEVMVGVGEALAPTITELISFGEGAVKIAQAAIDSFNVLPEPIKETAVAFGLVTAAVVPLLTAISAVGFAMIGFQTALSTTRSLLAEIGVGSSAAAAGEAALATETVAVGSAMAGAAVELEAVTAAGAATAGTFAAISAGAAAMLTGAVADVAAAGTAIAVFATETIPAAGAALLSFATVDVAAVSAALGGLASGALAAASAALAPLAVAALAVGAAFAGWELGTWANNNLGPLTTLDGKISDLIGRIPLLQQVVNTLAGAQDQAGLSAAKQAQLIATLSKALDDYGISVDRGSMSTQEYLDTLLKTAAANNLLGTSAITTAEHINAIQAQFDGLTKKVTDQNAALALAKEVLDQAKDALDGTAASQQRYQLALNEYQKALDAANEKGKGFADSVAGITKALTDAETKFNSSKAVLISIEAQYDIGKASLAEVAAAYDKTGAAAKKAGEAYDNAAGLMAKTAVGNAQLQATYKANQDALDAYLTKLQTGNLNAADTVTVNQNVINTYKTLQTEASALGVSYYNATAAMLTLNTAANNQQTALMNASQGFEDINAKGNTTVTQQEAIAAAFKTVQSAAAAIGLSVQNVGGSLLFVASNAQTATPQLNALAKQMTDLYGGTVQLVNVNGQLVATSGSVAAAQNDQATAGRNLNGLITQTVSLADGGTATVLKFADAHNAAATATRSHAAAEQAFGATIINVGNDSLPLISTIGNLGNAYRNAAVSVTDATVAFQSQTGAILDMTGNFTGLGSTVSTVLGSTVVKGFGDAESAMKAFGNDTEDGIAAIQNYTSSLTTEAHEADGTTKSINMLVTAAGDFVDAAPAVQGASRSMSDGFDAVAEAAYNAADAVKQATMASDQYGGFSSAGFGGGGSTSGASYGETLASFANSGLAAVSGGITNSELNSALGALGFVNTSGENFQSVGDFNSAMTNAANTLGLATKQITDAFGNVITVIDPFTKATSDTSSVFSHIQQTGSSAATALGSVASTATSTTVPSMIALSSAATGAATPVGAFISATDTAAIAAGALGTATASAAVTISDASTTVAAATQVAGAAAVAVQAAVPAIAAALGAPAGAVAVAPNLSNVSLGVPTGPIYGAASASTIGTVSPYGSPSTQQAPVIVNVTGNTLLSQQGIVDLTNRVQQATISALRQAGMKI